MRARVALPSLLLATAFATTMACGGAALSVSSSPPDSSPSPSSTGREVILGATSGPQLAVLHVDPSAGTVALYGPVLPGPGSDVAAITALWSSPDLARVLALVSTGGSATDATGTSTLYAGDGTSWRAIDTFDLDADAAYGRIRVAPDASMLRTFHTSESLLGFDGTTVYAFPPYTQFSAFAPDASYFLYLENEETTHARTPSGVDHVVAPPSAIGGSETPVALFSSSLILSTDTVGGDLPTQPPAQLSFVDLEGDALSVSGFDTDASALADTLTSLSSTTPTNIADRFEIVGGRVGRLFDRGVEPLGQVPASTGAIGVLIADAERTVVFDGTSWELLDANGNEKSTFAPPGPVLCASDPSETGIDVEPLLASLSTSPRWALLQVGHALATPGCTGGTNGSIGETDDVLWDMDANRTQILDSRVGDTAWYGPEYQPSPDGTSLVWIDTGAIHRFRIASFVSDVLASSAVPVETSVER